MSPWEYSDDHGAILFLARWLLLECAEQSVTKGSRTGEDSVHVEGGRSSGRPPAPVPCPQNEERAFATDVSRELASLLKRECSHSATAQETRRVAELLECLDREEEARPWWEKAARMGDADARDYLEILDIEMNEEEESDRFTLFGSELIRRSPGFAVPAFQVRVRTALERTDLQLTERVHILVREIERFLADRDPMTDGRRC